MQATSELPTRAPRLLMVLIFGALMLAAPLGCQTTQQAEAEPVAHPQEEPTPYGERDNHTPTPMEQPKPQAEADSDSGLTDGEVEQFAHAYIDVMKIQQTYQPQLEAAQTMEEAQALQVRIEQEVTTAIEARDMTIDEFNAIAQVLPHDHELRQRVQQEVDAIMMEESS